jgi:ribosomal protein S18 acetylase RimI-like enzyme
MKETTRESFREMIERVTEGTLDRHDTEERRLHGAGRAAERYVEMLEEIDANTDLWQLAYDPREKCIGLVVPQRLDEERGTINYIGVVPEARGHGYVDDLMRRGIDLLHESRIDIVVADVDALNSPVIAALQRSGWIESGGSWRFDLRTAEQER